MRIEYDPEADALYIQLRPVAPGRAAARPISDDVIADYGPDGALVGLEILGAGAMLGADSGGVTVEVAGEQEGTREPRHAWGLALLSLAPGMGHERFAVREGPRRTRPE